MASSFINFASAVAHHVASSPAALVTVALIILTALIARKIRENGEKQPPALPDTIPFLTNTYQYLTDISRFMDRVTEAMRDTNVITFRLGPKKVYLVQGSQNTQPLLRMTDDVGSEPFAIFAFDRMFDFSPKDRDKFAADKSSRMKRATPGSLDNLPDGTRYWYGIRRLYDEYMTRPYYSNCMAEKYYDVFSASLGDQPAGEWNTVPLFAYLKEHMARSATVSLCGQRIFDLNPGFIEKIWSYDEVVFYLLRGAPKWLDRRPWETRDEFLSCIARALEGPWKEFDWNGPAAEADWEESLGSRFYRECVRWSKEHGLSMRSARGLLALMIFGTNSNSVPLTAWAMFELLKDPVLYQDVRRELETVVSIDPMTGKRTINTQKLVSLPLLQSVMTETLRVHLYSGLLRVVNKPIVIDGYIIKKGCMVHALTRAAHLNEAIWGYEGHPASEFWGRRHVRVSDKGSDPPALQFSVVGDAGSFVPFGGGPGICPGRLFAKQEILLTLAMIITQFDVEFVEWRMLDGGPSDRAAQDDPAYAGAVTLPPDREMRIRWKRLY